MLYQLWLQGVLEGFSPNLTRVIFEYLEEEEQLSGNASLRLQLPAQFFNSDFRWRHFAPRLSEMISGQPRTHRLNPFDLYSDFLSKHRAIF